MAGGNNNNNNSASSNNGNSSSSSTTSTTTTSSLQLTDYLKLSTWMNLDLGLQFQMLWILFAILAGLTTLGLVSHLRLLHHRSTASETWTDHRLVRCLRYMIPAMAAVAIAGLRGIQFNNVAQFAYVILLGVAVPLGLSIVLQFQGIMEHWRRTIPTIIAWLLWISASIFTTHWYWHYKQTHSGGYDENPHLAVRNGTLIPFWIITIVFSVVTILWSRYQVREEAERSRTDPLLPQTTKASETPATASQSDSLIKPATEQPQQKRRFFSWRKQQPEETKRTFRLPWSKKIATQEKVKRKGWFA